ncbi:MAG TPA: hypothetical protein VLB44_14745 [Kofleriaceae bacterium]|nr:hypothetical protein [Kofleriaceae bacterium]
MSEAARLSAEGDRYAELGVLADAARAFDRAAELYLDEGRREEAFHMLVKLASIDARAGQWQDARDAIERALDLPSWPEERIAALMLQGSIYDALGEERAIVVWTNAATHTSDDELKLVCTAHLAGSLLRRGDVGAIQHVATTLEQAGEITPRQRVTILGAAGESAGRNGTSLLAQAVLLVMRHPEAWTDTNAAYWDLLVDRAEPQLATDLCGLGSLLTRGQKSERDHGRLVARVGATIERVARTRGISLDDLLSEIARDPSEDRLAAALRALVPDDEWVIERG